MEKKPDIESKIDKTLESAKGISPVDAPAFFTDKTVIKLRNYKQQNRIFSGMGLLKIAACFVLLTVNVYTIRYILNSRQNDTVAANNTATISDFVTEYQPNDVNELSFEEPNK